MVLFSWLRKSSIIFWSAAVPPVTRMWETALALPVMMVPSLVMKLYLFPAGQKIFDRC